MIARSFRALGALAACAAFAGAAQAHNLWLLPSTTVMSTPQWVTVDAAVSNDLFYFNHVPLPLDNLVITNPEGKQAKAQNAHRGKLRSVFDVELDIPGTWRMALINQGLVATYRLDGERKRWRGSADQLATKIPAGATELQVTESVGRVETFVTVGKPSGFEPTGRGIELVADSHPNDLFSGEEASFKFLVDGKPASELKVSVVAGATRYRNQLGELELVTDSEGRFSVTWPQPGMYWIEATTEDDRTTVPQAGKRRLSYTGTFEVLPQ
jgi:uncharacterized GH25 family protein